jgi:hypothetical protein
MTPVDDETLTHRAVALPGVAVAVDLPSVAELARLPANHRRVVAALLTTLSRHIVELASLGAIAASGDAVERLVNLSRALGSGPPEGRGEALRQALYVQLDEIEPSRLAGYGPLDPEQEAALSHLVVALRALIGPPHS